MQRHTADTHTVHKGSNDKEERKTQKTQKKKMKKRKSGSTGHQQGLSLKISYLAISWSLDLPTDPKTADTAGVCVYLKNTERHPLLAISRVEP